MSIFRSIMNGIFGHKAAAADAAPKGATEQGSAPLSAAPDSAPEAPGHTAHDQPVDVVAILGEMEKKSGQSLNWRQSIVDLLKLLGLDSSVAAREALAKELGYTGSTADSAAMNIWLHKQVIQKIVDNGGQLPRDMTS